MDLLTFCLIVAFEDHYLMDGFLEQQELAVARWLFDLRGQYKKHDRDYQYVLPNLKINVKQFNLIQLFIKTTKFLHGGRGGSKSAAAAAAA